MWKAQLFCDVCHHALSEGTLDRDPKGSTAAAVIGAQRASWAHLRNVGWVCAQCRMDPRRQELGDHAYYVGKIVTADGVSLHGKRVTILKKDDTSRTVHVRFDDPETGRWHELSHWFFEREFSPKPLDGMLDAAE